MNPIRPGTGAPLWKVPLAPGTQSGPAAGELSAGCGGPMCRATCTNWTQESGFQLQ